MKIINIPNIITSLNLICGCLAIYFGLSGDIDLACLYIVLGAVFDFFDGMSARALGVSGPIGKELDSLADVVTFGVAPSVLCYSLVMATAPLFSDSAEAIALFAFIMAAFSALRLAKFNCDERQATSFIGLPTPANALFWIGLSYVAEIEAVRVFMAGNAMLSAIIVLVLMIAMSLLLISEIPMFSFKFKAGHTAWGENKLRYSFLIIAIALIALFALLGNVAASLAAIILLYIIISIVTRK
ncbi:MAG: CDP-diacylglycerol--serine O-phosphatidyltransferase [Bacteroidales bacterium]|nr:CDP-diacylglycerol--serine O-phosphatidyltransferase [Bacteroidales bacterium]